MNKQSKISCPTCGKLNTWHSKNRFKPFCCERCKLIDLGEWASETRIIPGESIDSNGSSVGTNTSNNSEDELL